MSDPVFNHPQYLGGKGGNNGQYRQTNPQVHGGAAGSSNYTWSAGTSGTIAAGAGGGGTGFTWATINPNYPVEDAGIRAGEIIGYRCWAIASNWYNCDHLLNSVSVVHSWKPGNIENCLNKIEPAHFGYGFHAFKTMDAAQNEYMIIATNARTLVFGSVFLWGEIMEHEHGYRAEYAKIRSLDCVIGWSQYDNDILPKLREVYGVTGEGKA